MSKEILIYIKDSVDRIEAKQDKQDERIRTVENWQSNTNGKMTMFGLFCTGFGALLTGAYGFFKH